MPKKLFRLYHLALKPYDQWIFSDMLPTLAKVLVSIICHQLS